MNNNYFSFFSNLFDLIKLFLGNKTFVLLLLPIYLLTYQLLNYFFGFYSIDHSVQVGLWPFTLNVGYFWSVFAASSLVFINAIGLNLVVNRNNFYDRNTYIVALLYIVFMSLFHSSYFLNPILLLHSIFILILHQLFDFNKQEDIRKNVFNAFLFFGIGITVSPSIGFVIPLFIIAVMVIRPFSWKEVFPSIVGIIIPFIYYFSISYISDSSYDFSQLFINSQLPKKDFWFIVIATFIFILLCFFAVIIKARKTKIQTSKQIRSLVVLLTTFLAFSIYQILSFQQIEFLSLVFLPLSILLILAFLGDSYANAAYILFYILFGYSVIKFFLFLPTKDV